MGWVMGFEPTNTGTTIRGLRPLGDTHHILFVEKWHARRGSDASAAGGGTSELSEWQRSKKSRKSVSPMIFSGTATGHGHSSWGFLCTTERMARQKGLEPLTYCLEGSCSIQLSYWRVWNGAGDGNRTRVSSLEGWCSTIELHPQIRES